ncbi:MAG: hypothetical protein DLM54_11385 [Acidimicrobiales bacterium]|nr:MAG: hypothetical protein DLM54_11385 [Acidimicrobiales bacterium]
MLLASLNVDFPTILYFILAFLGVAALALYLIAITFILRQVSFALGTTLIGVRAIAARLQPVAKVVGGIAGNVGAISSALGVALGEEEAGGRTSRPARKAPAPRARPGRAARAASTAGPPVRRRRTAVRIPPAAAPVEEEPEEEEVVEEPEEEMAAEPEAAEPEEEMPVTPVAAATGPARFVPGREPGAWRFQ